MTKPIRWQLILFESQDSGGGGLEKWPVDHFFQTPLNPLSQIVSPATLLISHYFYNYNIINKDFLV